MLGLILIILLALVLLGYVALPLLLPGQADPLPDFRDPLQQELEEERDALFRAIRELGARADLAPERLAALRARYEAKAARVLRLLDERRAELAGRPPQTAPRRTRRLPVAALSLLGVMGATAVVMSGYVLPRVGQDATVTTGDLEAGRELRNLQQAAERNPSEETLLALADAYWRFGDAENAEATYLRASQDLNPAPALAYQRLGLLALQSDLGRAQGYLEQALAADPRNLDTLYTLAEVYFAQAQPEKAVETMEAYLDLPEGSSDARAQARLGTMRDLQPALRRATDEPNTENLLELADAYWGADEQERAADLYLRVLTTFDPHSETALSRLGQVLFLSGQTEEAAELLGRARELDDTNLDTLLFLGNAYFSLERYQDAIVAWERYVEAAGGEDQAGRAPDLIASAEARLALSQAVLPVSSQQLFAANCATCHGENGQGGSGPRLAGSPRAGDEANVRDIIQYGRGMMPGFGARLGEDELELLTRYVVEDLSQQSEAER